MNITRTTNSITFEFDEIEQKIIANDVENPLDWVEAVVRNKIARCKERLISEWTAKFRQEKSVENIPTDEDEMVELIFAQPDYKSRVERDKLIGLLGIQADINAQKMKQSD